MNQSKSVFRRIKCRLYGHDYNREARYFDPAVVNSRGNCFGGWIYQCRCCHRQFSEALSVPREFYAELSSRLAESICYGKCGDLACEKEINHAC